MGFRVVLASDNLGKIAEINEALQDLPIDLIPQSQFSLQSAEETAFTFVENALIKARYACEHSGLPALADDSGIEVDALAGEPGVYSARYSGDKANDALNNAKLLQAMENVPIDSRQARYQCVMVYLRHPKDPTPLIVQGTWEGQILTEPRGNQGFGYDPLFWVPDRNCSAAQLSLAEKMSLSHRGQVLRRLHKVLASYLAASSKIILK